MSENKGIKGSSNSPPYCGQSQFMKIRFSNDLYSKKVKRDQLPNFWGS